MTEKPNPYTLSLDIRNEQKTIAELNRDIRQKRVLKKAAQDHLDSKVAVLTRGLLISKQNKKTKNEKKRKVKKSRNVLPKLPARRAKNA